ncbi:MAG: hypothetical protein U0W40_09975 [Acidimicrobiia bacterium]
MKSFASPKPQNPSASICMSRMGENVVDHRDVDVVVAVAAALEQLRRERDRPVHDRQVGAVVVAGDLLLEQAGGRSRRCAPVDLRPAPAPRW